MDKITYKKTLDAHKNGIQFTLQGFETADNMSRRIDISLMASGDTYDLPLEGVEALMYITTPSAKEPSIAKCTIEDNAICYDVLPIVEAGVTEMQLKVIGTSVNGAKSVLISPRFAVEVLESNTEDAEAEKSTTFTALEDAVAKASAAYEARLLRIEVDENCVFRAFYADGTVYETDAVQSMLMQVSTELDLTSLVRDGLTNFTADEVAQEFEGRFKDEFARAIYSDSLLNTYNVPTFVMWDSETVNTPFKAGLVAVSEGFAIVYGNTYNHTAVAWTKGESGAFIRRTVNGAAGEWRAYITEDGGVIKGLLEIRKNGAKIALVDEDRARSGVVEKDSVWDAVELRAQKDENNFSAIRVEPETESLDGLATLLRSVGGKKESFKLYGEHNLPHPAQIVSDSYVGTGKDEEAYNKTLTFDFKPQIVWLNGHLAVRPSDKAYKFISGGSSEFAKVSWGEKSVTFYRTTSISGSGTRFNWIDSTYNYVAIG
jgi:hypothetical protein